MGNALAGKVCLVTGASRGIGANIARELAGQGVAVAVNYRHSVREAQQLEAEINQIGKGIAVQGDVSSRQQVDTMFKQIENTLGPVSLLVNNAGVSLRGLFQDVTEEEWQQVIDTNLKGPFLCCQRAFPHMLKQGYGRIVNIASIWGIAGASCESVYAASKGGLIALTRSLAKELGPSGITVNAIAPGAIQTDMLNRELDKGEIQALQDNIALGRLGRGQDITGVCSFLLSPQADYINGQVITVDGGWL